MLRPYKTFSEKVGSLSCYASNLYFYFFFFISFNNCDFCVQDKEIYRWPIKESIKAMLAWEWNIEKAREEEESEKKKAASRKISQTAQVCSGTNILLYLISHQFSFLL